MNCLPLVLANVICVSFITSTWPFPSCTLSTIKKMLKDVILLWHHRFFQPVCNTYNLFPHWSWFHPPLLIFINHEKAYIHYSEKNSFHPSPTISDNGFHATTIIINTTSSFTDQAPAVASFLTLLKGNLQLNRWILYALRYVSKYLQIICTIFTGRFFSSDMTSPIKQNPSIPPSFLIVSAAKALNTLDSTSLQNKYLRLVIVMMTMAFPSCFP